MTRAISWADWTLNVITGVLIFVGGSIIVAPDYVHRLTVSTYQTEDQQLAAELDRPAISDENLAKMDGALWP